MNIFRRIFSYKIDNHNKTEPFLEEKKENEREKKKRKWVFPIGPWKTIITLLSICFLAFSLSYYSAWFLGYQATVYLLYISVFWVTIMVLLDISSLLSYFKNKKEEKENR